MLSLDLDEKTCRTVCYILCYLFGPRTCLGWSFLILSLDWGQGPVGHFIISYATSLLAPMTCPTACYILYYKLFGQEPVGQLVIHYAAPLALNQGLVSDSLLYLTLPLDWNQRLVGQLVMLMLLLNFGPMIYRAVCYTSNISYLLILAKDLSDNWLYLVLPLN